MIVVSMDARLRLITQPDHARLASELLGLWHADGLPEHPRRDELLFAVAEHDNGWREADSAPYVDRATGRPYSFLDLPDPRRREIWLRGIERYRSSRPWPALLILEHGRALHRDRSAEPEWEDFFERLEELRSELLEELGASPERVAADYRWLALADDLSLSICRGREGTFERRGRRLRLRGAELELEPFPLVGATTFRVPCRHIPERRYRGDADLAVELAAARWEESTVRLKPWA